MDFPDLEPLSVKSLKEECVSRLEKLILTGQVQIGQRLPAERNLARSLGVSRPVLHAAVVDLASKGLVTISPRRGVFVNDFRVTGSLPLFLTLINYQEGVLDKEFVHSLINLRQVIESEAVRQAAVHITSDMAARLQAHAEVEQDSLAGPAETLIDLDFEFHLLVALASQNLLYPLLINSFKAIYTNLTGQFYRKFAGTERVKETFNFHGRIARAVSARRADESAALMSELLQHGAKYMLGENP